MGSTIKPEKPLYKKLGIKRNADVALLHAPPRFRFGDLPENVYVGKRKEEDLDVIVAFFTKARDLVREIDELAGLTFPKGVLWIAWSDSEDAETDITEEVVLETILPTGLEDIEVVEIDRKWLGMKLVWRKELRLHR